MLPFGAITVPEPAARMTDHRLSAALHQTIADPIVQPAGVTGAALATDAPLDELARAASAGDVEARRAPV